MWWLLLGAAWAGGKWDGHEPNVVAEATVAAPVAEVFAALADVRALERFMPSRCASDFVYGDATTTVGAPVLLTYHAGPMHRRLSGRLSVAEPPRRIEIDHEGRRGFITRFGLAESEGATTVTVTSYLNAPPWPFKKVYFTKVRPAWVQCYRQTLKAVSGAFTPLPPADEAPAPE